MKQNENINWDTIWWVFTIFGIPISLPWLIYQAVNIIRLKKRKSSLQGKVVLITGASSGLGEAMAYTFFRCGCKLILVSRRKQELQRVRDTLLNIAIKIPTHPPAILALDITEIDSIPAEVNKIMKSHGKIDILVNNAGVSFRGESMETKVDVDMKVMLINYFGQIALTKAVLPCMLKQNYGHILFISSIQGKIAIPYRSAYTASKHALQAWCDSTRAEISNSNVKVTVVSPGYIRTALSLNALTDSGQKYGVMDETTKTGYPPEKVSELILKSMLNGDKEIVIGTFTQKLAITVRTLFPNIYFKIMQNRAKKIKKLN